MECLSVQNGLCFDLTLQDTFDIILVNSLFANNKGPETFGVNILIKLVTVLTNNKDRIHLKQKESQQENRWGS